MSAMKGAPSVQNTDDESASSSSLFAYSDDLVGITQYKVGQLTKGYVLKGSNLWKVRSPGPITFNGKRYNFMEGFITHPAIEQAMRMAEMGWFIQNYYVAGREDQIIRDTEFGTRMKLVDFNKHYDSDQAKERDRIITELVEKWAEQKHWFGGYESKDHTTTLVHLYLKSILETGVDWDTVRDRRHRNKDGWPEIDTEMLANQSSRERHMLYAKEQQELAALGPEDLKKRQEEMATTEHLLNIFGIPQLQRYSR